MIALTAIILALFLGLAVSRYAYRPKVSRPDLEALRRDIQRAEKRHAPRKHLRKQMVEAVRQELERA